MDAGLVLSSCSCLSGVVWVYAVWKRLWKLAPEYGIEILNQKVQTI